MENYQEVKVEKYVKDGLVNCRVAIMEQLKHIW